jgi:hypothetical protein
MFSEREEAIIKIIGRKKMTIKDICEELFSDTRTNRPFDAEISVGNTIRRIVEKCEYNKLDWTLFKKRVGFKMLISKENI